MWNRRQLKEKGKICFKRFYWKSVLVCFICLILSGGVGSGVGSKIGDSFSSGMKSIEDNYKNSYDINETLDNIIGDEIGDGADYVINSEVNYQQESNISKAMTALFASGYFILFAIIILVCMSIGFIIKLLIVYPIKIGKNNFFMGIRKEEKTLDSLIFIYKSGQLKNSIITMFMKGLFQFLWSLLLVIPGVIKSYEYRMIPYILSENPEISRKRAFQISKQMMRGNKWKTFVLDLSFIGWKILSGITIGILGIFYVNPYVESTNAELYAHLREDALRNGYVSSNELIGF